MANGNEVAIPTGNKVRQYESKKFMVSIKPNHLWFMRYDDKKGYVYGIDAKFYLFAAQEMGVRWVSSRDPRQYQDRKDPSRKEWEIKAEYFSRSGELVRDICTVTMDVLALREKLRATWKKGYWDDQTKTYVTTDKAENYFTVDEKTREPFFNLPKEAELEIHVKILNMLDHVEKKLETISKRRIMQNALSEVPRNIALAYKADKATGQPLLPEGKTLSFEYAITVNKPIFSSQELIEMKARTQRDLYDVDLDPELTDISQADEHPALEAGKQPPVEKEEKPATPPPQQDQKPPEQVKQEPPKHEAKTNGAHPCSKCGSETTFTEGVSKKSGKAYKGYKCSNPQCKNMDFVN